MLTIFAQTDREGQARIAAFLDTFQRLGWTDGRSVRIEYRWDAGDTERTKVSAAELIHSAPDVIVATGYPAVDELHRLTNTIPIVFTQVSDPVDGGFVAGLARPGGNITGFQNFEPSIGGQPVAREIDRNHRLRDAFEALSTKSRNTWRRRSSGSRVSLEAWREGSDETPSPVLERVHGDNPHLAGVCR